MERTARCTNDSRILHNFNHIGVEISVHRINGNDRNTLHNRNSCVELVFQIKRRRKLTEREDEVEDVVPTRGTYLDLQSERIDTSKRKASKRESVIANLSTLMEQAFERGLSKKQKHDADERQQQKWFTIAAYLAQVMGRIVSDLEYESLRGEMEELKKRLETYHAPAGIDQATQFHESIAERGQSEDGQSANGPSG